jgi:hypothetical protein
MSHDPEVTVRKSELDRLRFKALDHDHYLRVLQVLQGGSEKMRAEARNGSEFAKGWLACMRLFHMTVLESVQPDPPTTSLPPSASGGPTKGSCTSTAAVPTQPALTTLWFLIRDIGKWLQDTFGPPVEVIVLILIMWWLLSAHFSGISGCTDPSGGLFNCP